ncbi:fumarylacetoacetate hydrolase family protein [Acidicapsa ligni]|uniref:fumarylacetoacetate hydrolase family protein n=1 Tax=Acidicapsa ligni TaxID=542300 RepID=UPI0021E0B6AE|nr:fumarylacetoacetate hydrolase family protein [Acidicapsa ligni]
MKLVSFSAADGKIRPGYLLEATSEVADLSSSFSDTLAVISSAARPATPAAKLPLADVKLHAPLANPPRIFCIGLNYRDHAIESKMELPKFPVVFFKMVPSIIASGENIVLPSITQEPDYEAEFAVVLGKGGYRIPAYSAMDHVYGYTVLNDVSARDIQFSTSQWSLSKSLPTFCPLGPAIVTADEIADPHALDIQLSIDGEVLQHSNTRELIFRIPELIEYISSITELLPGDIISTGTPAGVGLGRTPKRWLKAGETVTVSIEGLGQIVNPVIAG